MLGREIVEDASRVVYRHCIRTPLYRDAHLSALTGMDIYLKMELYQPVHSFKIRGASNKLSRIEGPEVITASSGNHGIAVAFVAGELGKKAIVVLPEDVNPSKLQMIRELGAEVVLKGRSSDERMRYAADYAASHSIPLIPSFDDAHIIGGQGTIGLEIQEQKDVGCIISPIGGGGLISGIALSYGGRGTQIFGVQAEGACSMYKSVGAGTPVTADSNTVADGIMVSTPGAVNVSIVRERVREIFLVSDNDIIDAFREMWSHSHVLMEPASASTVAALLKNASVLGEKGITSAALIITGGNVSDKVLKML